MSTIELANDLRLALRRFARAVVVISAREGDNRYAMVATAVSELSLDPPSMVICVNRAASIHSPLDRGAAFCINVLHSAQEEVAKTCGGATKGEARFAVGEWREDSQGGVPWLADAQASILCDNVDKLSFGTHQLFVGRVTRAAFAPQTAPLLYADGRYAALAAQNDGQCQRDVAAASAPA